MISMVVVDAIKNRSPWIVNNYYYYYYHWSICVGLINWAQVWKELYPGSTRALSKIIIFFGFCCSYRFVLKIFMLNYKEHEMSSILLLFSMREFLEFQWINGLSYHHCIQFVFEIWTNWLLRTLEHLKRNE